MLRSLLCLLAVLALAPAAQAASVTVVPPDGAEERQLDLAALTADFDVHDATYEVRAADGATSEVRVEEGISLGRLLRAAGVELDVFDYVEVAQGDGHAALVLRSEALARRHPPALWSDSEGLHFLRPGDGESDVNADDFVTSATGALTVRLALGDPIVARIEASARRVRVGGTIDFTAVVDVGVRPGLRFVWYFEEGPLVVGRSRAHRFRTAGPVNVQLFVYTGDLKLAMPSLLVRVGRSPRERRERPREERRDPPPVQRSGGAGTGSGGSGNTSAGTGSTPRSIPSNPAPPTPAPARPRRRVPRTPASAASAGTTVAGTLLASTATTPLAGLPRGGETRAARDRDEPLDVPTGVWVGGGIVLLLLLGWGLEGRFTSPFWRP